MEGNGGWGGGISLIGALGGHGQRRSFTSRVLGRVPAEITAILLHFVPEKFGFSGTKCTKIAFISAGNRNTSSPPQKNLFSKEFY